MRTNGILIVLAAIGLFALVVVLLSPAPSGDDAATGGALSEVTTPAETSNDTVGTDLARRDTFARFALANEAVIAPDLDELGSRLQDPRASEREQLVEELADVGGEAALPWLVQALGDSDDAVRDAALDAIVDLQGDAVAAALGDVLLDPNPRLRESAADALADLDGDRAVSLLQRLLSDPVPYVRNAAQDALERIERRQRARQHAGDDIVLPHR